MPSDKLNYYDILHVSRDAPREIIRSCYRTLMQKLKKHPDLGGDNTTAAQINEAYAVLGNVERRAEYDAQLDVLRQLAGRVSDDPVEQVATPGRVLNPDRECIFCETPHDQGRFVEPDSGCKTCGSPLSTAEFRRIESAGQRAVARIDKKQNISYYTRWPQSIAFVGHTEDISLNGMRFVTGEKLIAGQRIKIVSEVLDAVASVTHCFLHSGGETTQWAAGVSFATLRFARSIGGFVSDRV